jgi:hypothetical protein
MRRSNSQHRLWWAIFTLTSVVVVAGCQVSNGEQNAARGQATDTATATSTAAASSATPLATALPTTGWAIYRDARYPFELPIPPGWQLHALSWPQEGTGSCAYYDVGIFPPDVKPILTEPLTETNQELVEVSVSLTCAPAVFDSGQRWIAEGGAVTVGGTTTTVYDRTDPDGGPVLSRDCAAGPVFGRLQYIFYEQSPPSTAARDISVFRAILQGFQYMGK